MRRKRVNALNAWPIRFVESGQGLAEVLLLPY
jgi:hypothetical protein